MKKSILVLSLIFLSVLFFSCSKDDDDDFRDKYEATYNVVETWVQSGTKYDRSYTMTIDKSSQSSNVILLINIGDYGAGVSAEATIDGNRMTISQQTLSNDMGINGSGTLNGNVLSFSYQESDNDGYQFNINSTATKR